MQLIDQDGQKYQQKRRTDNRDAPVVKAQDAAQCAACVCAERENESKKKRKKYLKKKK